jgi:nicotinamidase-related amidase
MVERVWDSYLSEQDRVHVATDPAIRKGVGTRPVLLLVDLYRWVFGDEPEPLLESVKRWPGSCGLTGWKAMPYIQRLLGGARRNDIPIIHVTGLEGVPGWRDTNPRSPANTATPERLRRRYDIVDEVAPIEGEMVVGKTAPSAFNGTPLLNLLQGLDADTLIVSGESTSGCVRATVVDGKSYRYKVIVPEECVFDRHEAPHAINLFDMDQKYADVVPLDEALAYMDRIAAAQGAREPVGAVVG